MKKIISCAVFFGLMISLPGYGDKGEYEHPDFCTDANNRGLVGHKPCCATDLLQVKDGSVVKYGEGTDISYYLGKSAWETWCKAASEDPTSDVYQSCKAGMYAKEVKCRDIGAVFKFTDGTKVKTYTCADEVCDDKNGVMTVALLKGGVGHALISKEELKTADKWRTQGHCMSRSGLATKCDNEKCGADGKKSFCVPALIRTNGSKTGSLNAGSWVLNETNIKSKDDIAKEIAKISDWTKVGYAQTCRCVGCEKQGTDDKPVDEKPDPIPGGGGLSVTPIGENTYWCVVKPQVTACCYSPSDKTWNRIIYPEQNSERYSFQCEFTPDQYRIWKERGEPLGALPESVQAAIEEKYPKYISNTELFAITYAKDICEEQYKTEHRDVIGSINVRQDCPNVSNRTPLNDNLSEAKLKLQNFFANIKPSVWKDASGNFNTARLASDLTAGVVLGTVGGVVSGVVIKKKQIEKGFEALRCSVGGQNIAGWGDEFTVGFRR